VVGKWGGFMSLEGALGTSEDLVGDPKVPVGGWRSPE